MVRVVALVARRRPVWLVLLWVSTPCFWCLVVLSAFAPAGPATGPSMVGTCPHTTCSGRFPGWVAAGVILVALLACASFVGVALLLARPASVDVGLLKSGQALAFLASFSRASAQQRYDRDVKGNTLAHLAAREDTTFRQVCV